MSYNNNELSIDKGNPVELYLFSYYGRAYAYTSSQFSQTVPIEGVNITFNSEFIERGDSLKLGNVTDSSSSACLITVLRNNSIALLYQGAPPESDTVKLTVYRMHGEKEKECIKILDGVVSQVRFNESVAELTITIENVLNRNIPRGKLSYFCQNCIYDSKCGLNEDDFGIEYMVHDRQGLTFYSTNLTDKPDDYYKDGVIKMGNTFRQISEHKNNHITIKYPIAESDLQSKFIAYPGCDNQFSVCATKFHNSDNFSGVPYIQPYNVFKNPAGKGAYWVHGNVIYRDTNGNIYGD